MEYGYVYLYFNYNNFLWLLFLGLLIYFIIEGFFIIENIDIFWGVVIYKVFIVIIFIIYFIMVGYLRKIMFFFLVLFVCMILFGSFFKNNIILFLDYLIEINVVVIGIFFYVFIIILFESSKDYKFNLMKFSIIFIGVIFVYLF